MERRKSMLLEIKMGRIFEEAGDVLVLDRLESNNTGVLPECLKIYDKALGKAKKAVDAIYPRLQNTVRGYALLYGCNSVAFCDYTHADEITGRYTAKILENLYE